MGAGPGVAFDPVGGLGRGGDGAAAAFPVAPAPAQHEGERIAGFQAQLAVEAVLAAGRLAARFKGADAQIGHEVGAAEGHVVDAIPRTQPLVAIGGAAVVVPVRADEGAVLAAPEVEGAAGKKVGRVAGVGDVAVAAGVVERSGLRIDARDGKAVVKELVAFVAREPSGDLPAAGAQAVLHIGRDHAVFPDGIGPVGVHIGAAVHVHQRAGRPRGQARLAGGDFVALPGGGQREGGLCVHVPLQRAVGHGLARVGARHVPVLVHQRERGPPAQRAALGQRAGHVQLGVVVVPASGADAALQAEGAARALAHQVHGAAKVVARHARELAGPRSTSARS